MTTVQTTGTAIPNRLLGKRIVVTGGARGIGASIARRSAAEGAEVVILDRLVDEGAAFADETGCRFAPVDLTDHVGTAEAMGSAIAELGGVDVLVNNAGILRFSPLLDISVEEWETTFTINTTAMLVTTQIAARAMIAGPDPAGPRRGTIINLASMAGKTGGAGQGHYAASKAAVIALTRVTALELGPSGITANCLCPGYVLTEMGAATRTEEDVALWSTYSPLGRLADPADVAGVATFLASDDAAYMTGQALNVTGGMIMH
ncbi:SDR family NAD(P)-dependent oxidoreductase [Herbiconiux flava]|uniref:3-oxoacyl-[acyl-carrier protein] reductase n=1 Tax=Herbiconiux flava TaxID=881268 RepID=A0A852SSW3_9MICO|nr:SDR family NAD(P)-dependent oxidoreductase [Herbiconiux flava]NYD71947.1 3-oxoacyl-[acyl-carrier protein] reductase [Herbiconiux flava]